MLTANPRAAEAQSHALSASPPWPAALSQPSSWSMDTQSHFLHLSTSTSLNLGQEPHGHPQGTQRTRPPVARGDGACSAQHSLHGSSLLLRAGGLVLPLARTSVAFMGRPSRSSGRQSTGSPSLSQRGPRNLPSRCQGQRHSPFGSLQSLAMRGLLHLEALC